MLAGLSLRFRVFLFFALLGIGGVAVILAAVAMGYARGGNEAAFQGFVLAAIIASFALLGMTAGVWLLFDENIAKPIERLAAGMRSRAHADAPCGVDANGARYLGDLAPAALAVSDRLRDTAMITAEEVARRTARLEAEKDRLTALLTEIPVAMVLVNPAHQIVLYDQQAAGVLGQVAPPRLNASIFDYLQAPELEDAYERLLAGQREVGFTATGAHERFRFDARLKRMGEAPGYMLLLDGAEATIAPDAARPLTYDFDLIEGARAPAALKETALRDLVFMVFDTETTGLLPHRDEIVQIGAVRVVKGRIVNGERINRLVNPGRPIPPASTKVHGVSDAMVAGAPDIRDASAELHHFARDSVIVAHNAPFDMAFLRRHGPASGLDWSHPVLDTVLLSAVLFGASQTHTLDALCDRLGVTIPPEMRHTALGDAQATGEALCRMLPMLEARGFDTFGAVIAQTRKHGRLLEDLN